nr:uncharacterized protein LOC111849999 [Paramormyrops kingsleyae]
MLLATYSSNADKAVKDCSNVRHNWEKYRVRVLGEAESYSQARRKLKKAEMTSDLQTDSEAERGPRKRKKRRFSTSESEEETCAPRKAPPPPPVTLLSSAQPRCDSPPSVSAVTSVQTPKEPHITKASGVQRDSFIKVLTILEDMKDTLSVHGRMLQTLLRQQDKPYTAPSLPEGMLPLKNLDDVQAVEQKLEDQEFFKNMVCVVSEIGGRTVDEATRRMMAYLMSNELACQYNYVGRHGKRQFQGLRLFEVFYDPSVTHMGCPTGDQCGN